MAEEAFQHRLGVVERAFERDGVDIVGGDRGHLAALHVGDAAVRIKDEDIDLIEAAKRLDRRGAGVARGGADDGGALAVRFQRLVHQPAEQLHRHVLEGERRAVEQLQHEEIVVDLGERRHRLVAEGFVGRLEHGAEIGWRNRVVEERAKSPLRATST